MYKRSFLTVATTLAVVGLLCLSGRYMSALAGWGAAPSSYDPQISVQEAVKTSQTPLLIEFYTDACGTCQMLTPWVHTLGKKYKNDVTLVMVNLDDPNRNSVAEIFNVQYVPSLFVFDFKHMAKAQVDPKLYGSKKQLEQGLQAAIAQAKKGRV
jgi:thiol-disulfide isomerase/thioredoxin